MNKLLAVLLVCVCLSLPAATHYVDSAATNGLNTGASWANAWTNIHILDRSQGMAAAGDTVYIRGTWTNTAGIELQEGASGNWLHYIFAGNTLLYEGLILRAYTEVNAGIDQHYETNIIGTYNTYSITNNSYLTLNRSAATSGVATVRSVWIRDVPVKVAFVHSIGARTLPPPADTPHEYWVDPPTQPSLSNAVEIVGCWIQNSSGRGTGAAIDESANGIGWGVYNIHHCLFSDNESDILHVGRGTDFHHNIVQPRIGAGGGQCNDTFIIGGTQNVRIYNNIIEPADNTLYYLFGGTSDIFNLLFYGNVILPVRSDRAAQTVQGSGVLEQDTLVGSDYVLRSNNIFAHNTWVTTTNDGPGGVVNFITKNQSLSDIRIDTAGLMLLNNLSVVIDSTPQSPRGPFSLYPSSSSGFGTNDLGKGWYYTSNSIVLDHNFFGAYYPGNINAAGWGQTGDTPETLTNAADIQRVTGWSHNRSDDAFRFVSASGFDFRPAVTNANMGTNIAALVGLMPEIDRDIYGNTRTNWTAGAVDYRPQQLVLWFTFDLSDGWTTNHVITDYSGFGNHGYYMPSTNHNTWPSWTNGPGGLGAAHFSVNWTNGGFTFGTYAAILSVATNANCGLTSFTQGTWAMWVWVDAQHLQTDHDDIFLTSGQNSNNWFFGKYYSDGPQFSRATSSSGQEPLESYSRWPNLTNSAWHHYAVTWDGTNWTPYLDGLAYTSTATFTNSNSGHVTNQFTGNLVSTNDLGPGWSYIALGVNSHSGTPSPDDGDGLPNNGQSSASMADVRIYNRALSAAEVLAIYSGTNAAAALSLACPASSGTVDTAYSSSFTASGGTGPYTYAVISGALPNGLTLNTGTGAVTGTPTVASTFSFTGQVTDSLSATASASCSITISSAPTQTGKTHAKGIKGKGLRLQ